MHYLFKSYGNFDEWVEFDHWQSFIGKGLRLQPAQKACLNYTKHYWTVWTGYLAGLFNVELLGGDKEYSVGDVEKENWRLQENTRHSSRHPVHPAHPSIWALFSETLKYRILQSSNHTINELQQIWSSRVFSS